MAEEKKTAVVKPIAKAAVKVEAAKEEKKVEAAKAEAPAKKEAVKKAPAKKAEAPKKAAPAKAAAKATAPKKAAAPKKEAPAKNTVFVQVEFGEKKYSMEDLVKIAKDVWVYDLKQKAADFKSVEIYVKPFEDTAYYVINGTETGSFGI